MIRRKTNLLLLALAFVCTTLPEGARAAEGHKAGGLVPPPPPDTPALMSSPYGPMMMNGMMPIDMMSADALKQRQAQLTKQLDNAKSEQKEREKNLGDLSERSKQFDELFQEGVISRKELDSSKEELKHLASSIEESKVKVSDLQYNLQRVADKLKVVAKYSIAQKQIKPLAKMPVKLTPLKKIRKPKVIETVTKKSTQDAGVEIDKSAQARPDAAKSPTSPSGSTAAYKSDEAKESADATKTLDLNKPVQTKKTVDAPKPMTAVKVSPTPQKTNSTNAVKNAAVAGASSDVSKTEKVSAAPIVGQLKKTDKK